MDYLDYMWTKLIVLAIAAFIWGFIRPSSQHREQGQHGTAQIPEDRR